MTPLIVANYSTRCGNSSIMPLLTKVPNFLDVSENLGGDRGSWIGLLVRLRLRSGGFAGEVGEERGVHGVVENVHLRMGIMPMTCSLHN
jgi:hypothetical protein